MKSCGGRAVEGTYFLRVRRRGVLQAWSEWLVKGDAGRCVRTGAQDFQWLEIVEDQQSLKELVVATRSSGERTGRRGQLEWIHAAARAPRPGERRVAGGLASTYR